MNLISAPGRPVHLGRFIQSWADFHDGRQINDRIPAGASPDFGEYEHPTDMLLAGHVIHGWQLKEIRYQIDSAFGRVQETDPDSGNHDPGQEMWQIDHGLHIFAVFRAPNFINQKRQHDRNREHEYDFHQADDNGILQSTLVKAGELNSVLKCFHPTQT